jgi:AbrB family looped-hinge helix DNA binding protein
VDTVYRAKMTSKGQVTIPIEIRRRMGLNPGDLLEIRESREGYVFHKHVEGSPFDSYVGYLKADNAKTDSLIEDMRGLK